MSFEIIDSMEKKPKRFEKLGHTENHLKCQRCKIDVAENSIPKKEFKTMRNKKQVTIKKITLVRGSLDDCQGWIF